MDATYEVAIVEDLGEFYGVKGVFNSEDDLTLKENEKIVNLSFVAYTIIKNKILSNENIYINKHMVSNEVLPFEVLILDGEPGIENIREASIVKIRTLINPVITKVSGLALYGFMVLNNELVSKGWYFYDGNREEKYLEILETGDEKLINKLEEYLNYKDEIERVSQLERQFSEYIRNINDESEVSEILKLETKFLEEVYPQLK
jgi:predicted DNA-binding transcriptional regulator